jgi:hypothetical protein
MCVLIHAASKSGVNKVRSDAILQCLPNECRALFECEDLGARPLSGHRPLGVTCDFLRQYALKNRPELARKEAELMRLPSALIFPA